MPYIAFVLDDESRDHLLKSVPTSFSKVIAHHVTLVAPPNYNASHRVEDFNFTSVIATTLHVGEDIEAIGVKLPTDTFPIKTYPFTEKGESFYHITLSHESSARPVKSNTLRKQFVPLHNPIFLTGTIQLLK